MSKKAATNKYVAVAGYSGPGQLLQHESDPRKWLVKVFIAKVNGKKKYASRVVKGGKRNALAALAEIQNEKHKGRLSPRSTSTLDDLIQDWIPHKARTVSGRTMKGYKDNLKWYVQPTLGHRRLTDLTLREIDALYDAMLNGNLPRPKDVKHWSEEGRSPNTVRLTHVALRQALSQAVRWGLIPHNPAHEATLPQIISEEKPTLTLEQRSSFIRASSDAFYRTFYRFLLDTGVRPGEACALLWSDVNFARERFQVVRTVTKDASGEGIQAHPKTDKSNRTLPLFGLKNELLAHLEWQREHGHDASGYVFTNQSGASLKPWTFGLGELRRVLTAAGYDGLFPLYSFRHTFATLNLQSGTPLKVVSEWLGHATIRETANTYQHLSQEVGDEWAKLHVEYLNTGGPSSTPRQPN